MCCHGNYTCCHDNYTCCHGNYTCCHGNYTCCHGNYTCWQHLPQITFVLLMALNFVLAYLLELIFNNGAVTRCLADVRLGNKSRPKHVTMQEMWRLLYSDFNVKNFYSWLAGCYGNESSCYGNGSSCYDNCCLLISVLMNFYKPLQNVIKFGKHDWLTVNTSIKEHIR